MFPSKWCPAAGAFFSEKTWLVLFLEWIIEFFEYNLLGQINPKFTSLYYKQIDDKGTIPKYKVFTKSIKLTNIKLLSKLKISITPILRDSTEGDGTEGDVEGDGTEGDVEGDGTDGDVEGGGG